jgi:3-oxoacyl-[acyl-carrier-protein] synthase I
MVEKSVVLEQYEIISPFGNLSETVADCMDGVTAIRRGPCFGVPVGYAPFKDESNRSLSVSAERLKSSIDVSEFDPAKTVFIFCCAKGDISSLEAYMSKAVTCESFFPVPGIQADIARSIIMPDAVRTIAISNACASGSIAIETAKEYLESGLFTNALISGFDALSGFVATGFHSLGALSMTNAKPFDADRDGLTLGEAAAVLMLTYRTPFEGDIVVAGAGSSNDANHRTGPSRTGEGLMRAAQAAMNDACISPMEVGAIKCHGTATNYNDAMEAKAICALFAPDIPPCCSIKGAIGHGSGAGSLMEAIIAAQFLQRHALPPTAGFNMMGVDEKIPVSNEVQLFEKNTILCLSAGFGGVNAALVLKEHV